MTEAFKMAEVINIKRKYGSGSVPWHEFEPMLNQLRNKLDCNQQEALQYMGYAGATHLNEWRKKGSVPILAVNSIKWILSEAGIAAERPIVRQFSPDELALLFGLANGFSVPDDKRRAIIGKLAMELAR